MTSNKKVIAAIAGIALVCFLIIYTGLTATRGSKGKGVFHNNSESMDMDTAKSKLAKMVEKIEADNVEARKAHVEIGGTSLKDELPEIDKYPLSVTGDGNINIEIFSSGEKAGKGNDGWLNECAEKFNKSGATVGGQTVSVSVRSIASGTGMDYIVSGKYLPDAYTPSNQLWGKMMEEEGVAIHLEEERLVGNVAGILTSKKVHEKLKEKYGDVDMKAITEATADNEIAMGYANPFASATGLNFLMESLYAYDAKDPLSDMAISGFEAFQKNVPFVAYTTLQMKDAAESGVLDGFIMEYQTYTNNADLKKYIFTPFGVRHNNPVYSVGKLSKDKQEVLDKFLEFCKSDESQKLAKKCGFNEMDSYQPNLPDFSGDTLQQAQKLWKENKDTGRPVTAVFVADISGSMDGAPLQELKSSLINGSQYINSENSIGLVTYDSSVYINLPIGKFDLNQRSLFTGAVEDLSAAGGTATFDGIAVAMDMLVKAKKDNPDTKPMLFVLSDGETNSGYKLKDIRGILKALEIPAYTIGYNADIQALETISSINEAASINADSDDVIYKLKSLFNAQM